MMVAVRLGSGWREVGSGGGGGKGKRNGRYSSVNSGVGGGSNVGSGGCLRGGADGIGGGDGRNGGMVAWRHDTTVIRESIATPYILPPAIAMSFRVECLQRQEYLKEEQRGEKHRRGGWDDDGGEGWSLLPHAGIAVPVRVLCFGSLASWFLFLGASLCSPAAPPSLPPPVAACRCLVRPRCGLLPASSLPPGPLSNRDSAVVRSSTRAWAYVRTVRLRVT